MDRGLSVRAVAEAEGISPASVRYHIGKALDAGILVKIDGRGRHKRPVFRRPASVLRSVSPGADQPVADISLPPDLPGPPWRHIEHAEFRWSVKLSRPDLVTWDQASEGMRNGTRWRKWRYSLLGKVWGTVQLYSGTFRAVLHLDRVPVRWADAASWNEILYTLAMDAQARLARDLADLGTAVVQTLPDPIEDRKNRAAREAGHPRIDTGEIYVPVVGGEGAPREFVQPWAEINGSPPGPAVESPSVLYQHVVDHLPERVLALESADARMSAAVERIEAGIAAMLREAEESRKVQERLVAALERLVAPAAGKPDAPERERENPDNWRMFA